MDSLIKVLKNRRLKLNKTQQEIANNIYVSQNTFSEYENERKEMKLSRLKDIARELNGEIKFIPNFTPTEYKDFLINDIIVGQINFEISNNEITINSIIIDIKHRRKGIGRKVIEYLKNKYKAIHGTSVTSSIGFWSKMGAEFEYEIKEEMITYSWSTDEFLSFSIYL